jgi:hypothetical protein
LTLNPFQTVTNYPSITEIVIESPNKSLPSSPRDPATEQVEAVAEDWVKREIEQCVAAVRVKKPPTVDVSAEFLCYWLELLVGEMEENAFMDTIRTARKVDFTLKIASNESLPEIIIPPEALNRALKGLLTHITDPDASNQLSTYCQMLYNAANEALDVIRPNSTKGERLPGRTGPTDLHKYSSIYEAFYDVRDLILAWSSGEVGKIGSFEGNEEGQMREERVSVQLLRDVSARQVLLEEREWVDYEREELTCKVEVADSVFEELIRETIAFIQN